MTWWGVHGNRAARRSPFRLQTFSSRLNGDFLAHVAPPCGSDSSNPEQVLLPAVQVCDAIEQLLRACFILAGSLQKNRRRTGLQLDQTAFLLAQRRPLGSPPTRRTAPHRPVSLEAALATPEPLLNLPISGLGPSLIYTFTSFLVCPKSQQLPCFLVLGERLFPKRFPQLLQELIHLCR